MSASAPALARQPRRTVGLRLRDPAVALTFLSLIFALLLALFPTSFPRFVVEAWQNGRAIPVMILFTVAVNLGIYIRVAQRRSARPGMLAPALLGAVPAFVVAGLKFWLQAAIAHTLSGDVPNVLARVNEEILTQLYFGFIGAVFVPFVLIIFAQQFRDRHS